MSGLLLVLFLEARGFSPSALVCHLKNQHVQIPICSGMSVWITFFSAQINLFAAFPNLTSSRSREKWGSCVDSPSIIYEEETKSTL